MLELKNFILEYITDLGGVQKVWKMSNNEMIYEVLNLLYFMLQHGFYREYSEITTLLDPIIALLDGTCDVMSPP